MLKALLFGVALVISAAVAIVATAIIAVLFLFTSPANAATSPSPVYFLGSVEEVEEVIDVKVEKNEVEPVFLLEVTEVPTDIVIEEKAESPIAKKTLKDMTIPQLKKLAKEKGIYVKSSLRKSQIIELLSA